MRIPSGTTDQYIYFVAVDATDLKTRETGLTSFTVYRSRNGGVATAMTTPTINEVDATNMPGVYELLLDEDMTIDAGDDSQEMVFHITHTGMAPVTRVIELYRTKLTAGETATVSSGAVTVGTNNDKTGYALSAAGVDAVWDELITGHATASSFGKVFSDQIDGLRAYGDAGWATATGFSTHSAGDAANAVWNALLASYSTAGSFGKVFGDEVNGLRSYGDAGWATATGFSTHTAADVWTSTTRTLTASLDPTAAAIADAVWDEAKSGHVAPGSFGEEVQAHALTSELSDGTVVVGSFGATAKTDVNAEVVDVLNVDTLVAGQTVAESLRRIGALTSGVVSGAGTGTETFKDYAGSANTIVVTVDASGNRTGVTYN